MTMLRLVLRLSASPWFRIVALLGLAALALVSLLPATHAPPRTHLPGQLEHFVAYACVSALATFAFHRTIRPWRLAAAFVGYAAILEYSQRWSPGRAASVMDFVGSSAGALAGIAASLLVLHALARLDQARQRQ